ncbi:MAG: response regulator transcription factor [Prevotella sp.]|nr:response regulator transcription factor [Prevotella sp.]
MINYILADNQDLTRYALEGLVRQHEEHVVRRATDKTALIQLLKENENSVVVLDYTLFDFIDEEQLLIISERFSMASWVLISDELSETFLRRVIYSSHAFSIVFKDSPLKSIRDALQSAARETRYIDQRVMELLLAQRTAVEEHDLLTATEIDVIKAIARGKTTKEIATERFSSVHTITTHRKNIFRKLGVNTAHEVIKYALRAGLVNPSEFYI